MEAVVYEHELTSRSERLRRLKHALSAFLSEPDSARDVRSIALLVRIPVPSVVLKTTPVVKLPVRPTAAAAAAASPPSPTSPAQPPPRRYTKLRAKLLERRAARERAVRQCTAAAYARVHQATRDAVALARWLRDCESGVADHDGLRCYPRGVTLVVAAVLQPHSVADLSVYTAWQSLARDALHCSPLREADLILLNPGSGGAVETAFETVTRRAAKGGAGAKTPAATMKRVARYTSFLVDWQASGAPMVELASLLQPHQSLLLDITWCVQAGLVRSDGSTVSAALGRAHDGELFLSEFQRRVRYPKESRVAWWLSYSGSTRDGGGGGLLSEHLTGLISGGDVGPLHRRRARHRLTRLHATVARVYRGLARGHNTDGALLVGHGGDVADLVAAAAQVSLPQRPLALRPDGTGALRRIHHVGLLSSSPPQPQPSCLPPSAALSATRGLRDMFATIAFLAGVERADLYEAAHRFTRTLARRRAVARRLGRPRPAWGLVVGEGGVPRQATASGPPPPQKRQRLEAARGPATAPVAGAPTSVKAASVTRPPTATQRFLSALVAAAAVESSRLGRRCRRRGRAHARAAGTAVERAPGVAEGTRPATAPGKRSGKARAEPASKKARVEEVAAPAVSAPAWTEDV